MKGIILHRGNTETYTENSYQAITSICSYDNSSVKVGVEFDVRISKDNHLILSHDSDLSRVFGISSSIEETDSDNLIKTGLTKLTDILDFFLLQESSYIIDIEFKLENNTDRKKLTGVVVNTLKRYPLLFPMIIITSFDKEFINILLDMNLSYQVALILYNNIDGDMLTYFINKGMKQLVVHKTCSLDQIEKYDLDIYMYTLFDGSDDDGDIELVKKYTNDIYFITDSYTKIFN